METDITIANDERDVPYSNNATLSVYVMNTGRRTLNPDELIVFVDGSFRNVTGRSFFHNGTEWIPGSTINLSVLAENLSYDTDHTLKVVMRNGNEDSIIFRLKSESAGEDVSIAIENDKEAVPYEDNRNLTVLVRNTGDGEIDINSTSVLINGDLASITKAEVEGGGGWLSNAVANFTVEVENLEKDETHRMKVVVEGGAQAAIEFKTEEK